MTDCADCGRPVSPETVKVYVTGDGTRALALCLDCQPSRPRERQYSPSQYPSASDQRIEEVDDAR